MRRIASVVTAMVLIAAFLPLAHAQQFKILHGFGNGSDGAGVWDNVTFDNRGNLYGTTSGGGTSANGTVFELTPLKDSRWSETILHSFTPHDPAGYSTFGNVVLDASGNVYGAAGRGGAYAMGTVFELTLGSGGWSASAIFSFDGSDGVGPYGGLSIDRFGNLYGVAGQPIFELSLTSGVWTESVLYDPEGRDLSGVLSGQRGNLYGTTEDGGKYQAGSVYEVLRTQEGWSGRTIHSFGSFYGDGVGNTFGTLPMDSTGNLYGATGGGGKNSCFEGFPCGTIFELSPQPSGLWKETILYNFEGGGVGYEPGGGVVLDNAGNLYGTTVYGGSTTCGCGVVYELSPGTGGKWTYTLLHTFVGTDGGSPEANMILDSEGNLYGTTPVGGPYGGGVVFEIIP